MIISLKNACKRKVTRVVAETGLWWDWKAADCASLVTYIVNWIKVQTRTHTIYQKFPKFPSSSSHNSSIELRFGNLAHIFGAVRHPFRLVVTTIKLFSPKVLVLVLALGLCKQWRKKTKKVSIIHLLVDI